MRPAKDSVLQRRPLGKAINNVKNNSPQTACLDRFVKPTLELSTSNCRDSSYHVLKARFSKLIEVRAVLGI